MSANLIEFIENSFLKELISNKNITDISYNGEFIFYQDNEKGRKKSNITVTVKEAYDFIRQIANLSDSQFSYTDPILDISVGRYRINATHYAFSRKKREKTINFAIRVGFNELRIKNDGSFLPKKCVNLIDKFLINNNSIVIGGLTSSGKTELQKFLVSKLKPATRIIVIDSVDELDVDYINNEIDIQTWLNLEKDKNVNFDILIKNALRSNPDYLIVSEARGEEMLAILNSAMSGHPTITTVHSKTIKTMYSRLTRLSMLKNQNLKYDETLIDIYDHFKLLIHVKKVFKENGQVIRYVDSIATNRYNKIYYLYTFPNRFAKLPNSLRVDLNMSDEEFLKFKEEWETND